ncbi:MAG: VanZ family protein [Burkholderiales bacterium]|jgi:VanZ family protein
MFTTPLASPAPPRATALMRALSLLFAAAVALATLWPLVELRPGSGNPFAFLADGLPRWWTWFDVLSNAIAYAVLALLLCLAWLPQVRPWAGFVAVALAGSLLSLTLEAVQHYLPSRVPSLLDWIANSTGAAGGAWLGVTLNRAARRGDRVAVPVRDRWYEQGPPTGWLLLLLWLSAQLVPQRLLFATGHVEPALQRLLDGLQLPDAPDLSRAADRLWGAAHAPTGYGVAIEAASTICALCAVGAIAFALVQGPRRRLVLVAGIATVACGLRSLATQMVYGTNAPFAWLTPGAQGGLIVGIALLYGLETLGPRSRAALGLAAALVGAVLVNIAPEDPYFDSMVAGMRAGQLSNLHGLLRTVSVVWPLLALAWFWRRTARGARAPG